MKKINVVIDFANLGETTIEQANDYAKHVAAAIETEFSDADINVLVSERDSSSVSVTGIDCDTTEDKNRIQEITNEVWGKWC